MRYYIDLFFYIQLFTISNHGSWFPTTKYPWQPRATLAPSHLRWNMAKMAARWVECSGLPWEAELEEAAEHQASKRQAKRARGGIDVEWTRLQSCGGGCRFSATLFHYSLWLICCQPCELYLLKQRYIVALFDQSIKQSDLGLECGENSNACMHASFELCDIALLTSYGFMWVTDKSTLALISVQDDKWRILP